MTYTVESKSTSVPWDSNPRLVRLLTAGDDYDDDYTMLDEYNALYRTKEKIEARMKDLRVLIDAKMIAGGELSIVDGAGNHFTHRDDYTRVTLDAKWAEKRLVELGEKSKELEKHKKKTVVKGGLTFVPAKKEKEEGEES